MKMTSKLVEAFIDHIGELSRKSQADSLRSVLRSFEPSKEREKVQKVLRKREEDISDMTESYRAMP